MTDEYTSRRVFLKSAAGLAGAAMISGLPGCATGQRRAQPVYAPKRDKLRVAFIGTGGMGAAHIDEVGDKVECPCFCDVDTQRWEAAMKRWPHAKGYQDYRQMFDKQANSFDAVMIATPDHHHFPATMLALQHGKHCYTQKPLTHTVWEARQLTDATTKYNVATQMGNQGHAQEGWRLIYEWIRSGALGDVVETHTWTDRPIWPQGMGRPERTDAPPGNVDWDVWLGPAPERPYVGGDEPGKPGPYHWFNWRGWWDFGAGALGDMACHNMDGVFWALDPGHATVVEPLAVTHMNGESFPKAAVIRWHFPRNSWRPGFRAYWYDGGLKPTLPNEAELTRELKSNGTLFIGTNASAVAFGSYGESARIIPESKMKQIGKPPQMLERSPGHYEEWLLACTGEKPIDYPVSNFAYAAPMTESILLGNVALRIGRRLEWDGANLRVTNIDEANQYINKPYRDGWKVWS